VTEATDIRTDVETLLHYGKAVVPWITRWTGERASDEERKMSLSLDEAGALWVHQAGYSDDSEERELSGFLWQKEGVTRGGKPEFSQVSTFRQRTAMRKRLCQVCGQKIQTPVVNWLMATGQLEFNEDGEAITMNAPTCDGCIPVARELCPHLYANGSMIVKVVEYELWGVYGEAVQMKMEDGRPLFRHVPPQFYCYSKDYPGVTPTAVLAKQQVVRFTKYRIAEVP